jgi:hypothetical protein
MTIFKILIAPIVFVIGLKQYNFRIQQSLKFIDNNFYKFIKKFCFVSDKHKQRVCRENLGREEDCFLYFFFVNIKLILINKITSFQTNMSIKFRGTPLYTNVSIEFKNTHLQTNMSVELQVTPLQTNVYVKLKGTPLQTNYLNNLAGGVMHNYQIN